MGSLYIFAQKSQKMDLSWLSRTQLLLGEERLKSLTEKNVLIVGLGGIGSFAAEAIARAGIGKVTIVDGDNVEASNRNRQLVALTSTTGKSKADVMASRMKDINPEIQLTIVKNFLGPEAMLALLETEHFDYVIECIDSLAPKVELLLLCKKLKIKVVCSGGAGGKDDPTMVRVKDIKKVTNDRLIHYTRKRLRHKNIHKGIKVVFSEQAVDRSSLILTDGSNFKKSAYGTMSYLPAVFGLTVASVVIRDLTAPKSPKGTNEIKN
jgi:tRNA A37 threonylcarbamoyladenosine dehydratase